MCTISINPASIVALPWGKTGISVSLNGTFANSTSNSITVKITCQTVTVAGAAIINGNTWAANIRLDCPCNQPVTIIATCNDAPPCTVLYSTILPCTCCPTITTKQPCIEYNTSGHALVRFVTNAQLDVGCVPVTVQRDFGDGNLGMQYQVSGMTMPPDYTEVHAYNVFAYGYVYNSVVNVLPPSSCPASPTTKVKIDPPPKCATSPLLSMICTLFQYTFLLNGALAIVSFLGFLLGCVGCNPYLGQIVIAFGLTATLSLLFIWALCRKCACRVLVKLLGLLLLVIGVLLSMFIIQVACLQFPKYPLLEIIFFTAAALFFGSLILYFWLNGCCPVAICDFWKVIISTMLVALVATIVLFAILTGSGLPICVQPLGLLFAFTLALLIMGYASLQATLNNC